MSQATVLWLSPTQSLDFCMKRTLIFTSTSHKLSVMKSTAETQESSIRPPTATAALTSISTAMNETTVRQNCFLKNISKVSAYKRPQRGSMTSCSPFLWNPGNPRCFFDAGHILIKNGRKTSRNRTVEICFCRVSVFSRTHPKAVKNNLSRLLTRRNLRCIMSAF